MNELTPIRYTNTHTAHDTNNLTDGPCRAILVETPGNIKITFKNGKVDTLYVAAGVFHWLEAKVIWATGTTATGIHVAY